jgi:glutaredoxin
MATIRIYGKDTCGYTTAARKHYAEQGFTVDYVNLRADPKRIPEFLALSGGRRAVPLIQEESGKVTIGFGGT